jgi:hypothetical protein
VLVIPDPLVYVPQHINRGEERQRIVAYVLWK